MRPRLVIRLNSAPQGRVHWIRLDAEGRPQGHAESGTLAQAAVAATQRQVIGLVPATELLLTEARIPTQSRQRMLRAVPFALEDQLAEDIDELPREERDFWVASAKRPDFVRERPDPDVDLKELLLALKDVMHRADMFEHHHVSREKLSTRERMSRVLDQLRGRDFVPFVALFRVEEGRAGVVVTFNAILELVKSALIELIQTEPFAPIHVKARTVVLEDEDRAPLEVTVADD